MLDSRFSRRLCCGALLLLVSAAAVAALGRSEKNYDPPAPSYRQRGPAGAPVILVEFSDFQCPHCAMAVGTVQQIWTLYPGKIREVFVPTLWERLHPHTREAATAAECAGRQGKFWEYHDALFDKQFEWGTANDAGPPLEKYAKKLKLDLSSWKSCRRDPKVQAELDAAMREVGDRWIHSTPTFFINGKRFSGVRQLSSRGVRRIETLLSSAK